MFLFLNYILHELKDWHSKMGVLFFSFFRNFRFSLSIYLNHRLQTQKIYHKFRYIFAFCVCNVHVIISINRSLIDVRTIYIFNYSPNAITICTRSYVVDFSWIVLCSLSLWMTLSEPNTIRYRPKPILLHQFDSLAHFIVFHFWFQK